MVIIEGLEVVVVVVVKVKVVMVRKTYDLMMEASRDTQSLSSDPPRRLGMRPRCILLNRLYNKL